MESEKASGVKTPLLEARGDDNAGSWEGSIAGSAYVTTAANSGAARTPQSKSLLPSWPSTPSKQGYNGVDVAAAPSVAITLPVESASNGVGAVTIAREASAPTSSSSSSSSSSAATSPSHARATSNAGTTTNGSTPTESREEFLEIKSVSGYEACWWREAAYWVACVLSGFIVWLLGLWFPEKVIPYRYRGMPLREASFIHVVGKVHGSEMVRVQKLGEEMEKREEQEHEAAMAAAGGKLYSSDAADGRLTSVAVDEELGETHSAMIGTGSSVSRSPYASLRCFHWRHMTFIYSPALDRFVMQEADAVRTGESAEGIKDAHTSVAQLSVKEANERMKTGLTEEQRIDNLILYGENALVIAVPSIPTLLFQECFHPFYVFQMYSVILWGFENYYIFAIAIAIIAIVSIVQTLIETRRRMTELSNMARFECTVTVVSQGVFVKRSSLDLTPGDIVVVGTGVLPCDMTLLDGGCVVNESMLTGESVPVQKRGVQFPIDRNSSAHMPLTGDARSTLFSATKVLQLKPSAPSQPVLAMVVRTGFATTKGALILSILYPKPSAFKFQQQSYKFIAALFCVALVGFAVSVYQLKVRIGADDGTIVIRALDLITIVVPPSLPLALTVGVNFALVWLKQEQLFCISPNRITMAGKIRTFAFDKTGTLTAESLEFMGVLGVMGGSPGQKVQFSTFQAPQARMETMQIATSASDDESPMEAHPLASMTPSNRTRSVSIAVDSLHKGRFSVDTTHSVPLSDELKISLACCQSLALMDDALVGDPLEVQTFEAAKATLQDTGDLKGYQQLIKLRVSTSDEAVTYGVREQFEFSSSLQRMSTLSVDLSSGQIWAFVKGSPEMMESLCTPQSLPDDYKQVLAFFAHQGYRVIAIARKPMSSVPALDKDDLRRVVESDLTFLGLVCLENKLKPETEPTLAILRRAAIRCVMITGDNPLTACSVARECKLVEPGVRIFQSRLRPAESGWPRVEFVDTEEEELKLDSLTLALPPEQKAALGGTVKYELAVTGPVFKHLQDEVASALPGSEHELHYFRRVILNTQIFARMTPDQKAAMVGELQALGISTGMCGDGANDCSALKQAHVGVSLSESEASIAAPFTYSRPNISCIPLLLSEGRSSLVTSFQLFRFMAMYSMIQFMAVILTYFKGSVFGNWQYLYQDLWIVFPLTIFMGATRANRRLSVKRPSGDLLSGSNLFNLAAHITLILSSQLILFATIDSQYDYVDLPNPDNTAHSYMTTCLYYFSNFQYIVIAFLFSLGRPWKAHPWTNWKFTIWLLIAAAASFALLLARDENGFFRSDDLFIPHHWRMIILLAAGMFTAAAITIELILSPTVRRARVAWQQRRTKSSEVFGRMKPMEGKRSKLWHRIRGSFEAGWSHAHVY